MKSIPFSAPMIRAIQLDQKGMTRRVVKPPKLHPDWGVPLWDEAWADPGPSPIGNPGPYLHLPFSEGSVQRVYCPYGAPGDGLWAKETWGVFSRACGGRLSAYPGQWLGLQYKANEESPMEPVDDDRMVRVVKEDWLKYREKTRWQKWRSPRFMPKWASRITLEITSVRVERLQDITPSDAIAEGVRVPYLDGEDTEAAAQYALDAFKSLWDSINSKRGYPWDSNPWVWVVGFKKTKGGAE